MPERDWSELFPDRDYRFLMRLKQGDPADFFRPSPEYTDAIAERRLWLGDTPERYGALYEEGKSLLAETRELAGKWGTLPEFLPQPDSSIEPGWQDLLLLGRNWETDFLLLKVDGEKPPRLVAGCVCFPSSWSLAEKMGRPVDFIHEPVPGLNSSIGGAISTFLNKLRPDIAWLRANWGLAAVGERNMHPERQLPRLQTALSLDDVWLRIEDQALVALPESSGVLFGIRLTTHPLTQVVKNPQAREGLRRALETMPDAVAEYKGLSKVRGALVELLA